MRLIDADALIQKRTHAKAYFPEMYVIGQGYVMDAPTVDAVLVVHGKWIYNTDDYTPAMRCSICGYNKPLIAGETVLQEPQNYCPRCGAKMDAEE